jgi:hypothetical protein
MMEPNTSEYYRIKIPRLIEDNKIKQAKILTDEWLRHIPKYSHWYAIAMGSCAAISYKKGDTCNFVRALILSSISDIRSCAKDHYSLWGLANELYHEGRFDMAYKYMRFSWEEYQKYDGRLRLKESSTLLSMVDMNYQNELNTQKRLLYRYSFIISLGAILLLISVFFIRRQVKQQRIAKKMIEGANKSLVSLNNDLVFTNQIKEEYITRFILLCSTYIDRFNQFRKTLHKLYLRDEKDEVLKIIRSEEADEENIQDFYKSFDTAFLHLFPNFVSKFNELLADDGKIILKKGELLNTELRIFALIRLGITESSTISKLLRYSINTIYTYRAKVKNKAIVPKEDFENLVCNIK